MVPGPLSTRGASACLGRPSSRFGLAMGLLASSVTSVCLCKNSYCLLWAETLCAEFLSFIKSCDCLSDPDGWHPILRVRTQVKEQLAQGHVVLDRGMEKNLGLASSEAQAVHRERLIIDTPENTIGRCGGHLF